MIQLKEEVYDIGGMHCAACSSAVERVTRKLSGVERSDVNLPLNRLTICYDESVCSPADVVKKVEKAGFTATPHQENAEPASKEKETIAELRKGKYALWVSVVFAGVLLVVSMGQMLFPQMPMPDIISMETHPVNFALVQLLLTVPVLFLGKRFFISGFTSLLHGNPNMDTLVAISATASFLYSLVMTFLVTDMPHAIHNLYFESAAVVVALVSVGKYLEEANKEKTKDAITKLMQLAPDTALLVDENGQWEVPTATVKVGDSVLVKPGSRIPLDGVVIKGAGSINEAMLTGESLPVEKREDSDVIGGSVSVDGALYIRVTRTGNDTTLSQIIRFVEDAQGKKAPISRAADKVAGVFVPIVMGIALLSGVLWLILGEGFPFALKIFTSVLVIACPCAMGLATPTAIIVGTGLGASRGILIRNGEALELTHQVKTVIFDKTGTITEGKPRVTDLVAEDENALLITAYSLETMSQHPLSAAICAAAQERGISSHAVDGFENRSGRGLSARDAQGICLLVGNHAWMQENKVDFDRYASEMEALQREGKTVVLTARNGQALGLFGIADTMKPDAADTLARLHEMNIHTVLLTGDHRAAAESIGKAVGVREIVSEVLPTEKAEVVKRFQKNSETVMMVGDGINDAPALTQADVGCAIGNGSDIAIDAADVVLMRSELSDVYHAIRLSRLTIRTIRQNLFWAFCYNVIGIPIAAGVLYPAFRLLLSPMLGGLAMSLSSLFVVTNALRLKGKKL